MKVILGIICLQLCLWPVWTKDANDNLASNKDKRDASLLSQGYTVQQDQISVVPSVEVASGSYYEQEPHHSYGQPSPSNGQHEPLQGEQQTYAGQIASSYGVPAISNYQPSHGAEELGGHYTMNQPQRYVQGGTYGPPTAVLFQSNEDTQQGAQTNQAVATVRQLGTPHYTQSIGSSYSSPNIASVQNVHLPSGSYGAPVVGASLNFAHPTQSLSVGNNVFAGFSQQSEHTHSSAPIHSGHIYSSPLTHGEHTISSIPTQGAHYGASPAQGSQAYISTPSQGAHYSAPPTPVYGVPNFARQQHRFSSPYSKQLVSKTPHEFRGFNNKNYVNPFAGSQQSTRFHSTSSPPQNVQYYAHPLGGHSFTSSVPISHSAPIQYQSHAPSTQSHQVPSYPSSTGHSSSHINDGYGSGPSYASGSKGLGHFSSSASHSSPAYIHAPAQHSTHQALRSKSHFSKFAAFKPSAYLGSTDLSSTSQSKTYILPSDHSAAASSSSSPHQSHGYNTIRYSAV